MKLLKCSAKLFCRKFKFFDRSKLKTFIDNRLNRLNGAQIIKSISEGEEKIVGKLENASYQPFLLLNPFPNKP